MDRLELMAQAEASQPPGPKETKGLFASDSPLLKILGVLVREQRSLLQGLASVDMSTPEGMAKAQRLQGEIQGSARAVDRILDFAMEGPNNG